MPKNRAKYTMKTNTAKRRINIVSGVDKETGKEIIEKRKYSVSLNETEIAILKGALQYWVMDHDFGYELWGIQAASLSTKDNYYKWVVTGRSSYKGLYELLNDLCSVDPNYGGYWGDIDRILQICNKVIKRSKKQSKEFEEEYGLSIGDGMSLSEKELEQYKQEGRR